MSLLRKGRDVLPATYLAICWMLALVHAEAFNYGPSTPICSWYQMRAAVLRDILIIDGGLEYLLYQEQASLYISSTGPLQAVLQFLNFNVTFNTSRDNLTALFGQTSLGGLDEAVPFYSGAMFADDYAAYMFAGTLSPVVIRPPSENYAFGYEFYEAYEATSGVADPELGPIPLTLPGSVNRYVTDGAGVSIPSEKLGFYFGGMTEAPSTFDYDDTSGWELSDTLIEINMTIFGSPTWTNTSLPSHVQSRADGQLLWMPVSTHGVLIVLGGVVNPEALFNGNLTKEQIAESERISPTFMSEIAIYDITTSTWYSQNTTGTPPGQLSGFCAVIATDESTSTHNIYIYGGYNGLQGEGISTPVPLSDDVWVLSVPAFTWTRVYHGDEAHGRYFHSCTTPYPDQMWVVGGAGMEMSCLSDSVIKLFNLNSLTWQDVYDPTIWEEYRTPAQIQQTLNDAEEYNATINGFATLMDPALRDILNTPYAGDITVFYPYTNSHSVEHVEEVVRETLASWFGGILGIVLYLLLSTLCIIVLVLVRRRMLLRRSGAQLLIRLGTKTSRLERWINNMTVETDEKEALMEHEEDTSLKQTHTSTQQRKGFLKNIISRPRKADRKQEKTLSGRDDKSNASDEVYELRTQTIGDVGYAQVPRVEVISTISQYAQSVPSILQENCTLDD